MAIGTRWKLIPQDLRDHVLCALERGERPVDIAQLLEVSRIWVYQVKSRFKSSGERGSRPIGVHRVSRLVPVEQEVRAWITKQPDLTLAELSERLRQEKDIRRKVPAPWHQLSKWGSSFKKNSARQRVEAKNGQTQRTASRRFAPRAVLHAPLGSPPFCRRAYHFLS